MFGSAFGFLFSNETPKTEESMSVNSAVNFLDNEIDEEIDTTDLKKPFVMGDKARSGKKGTGLGLAIADSSCKLNGFELDIYCKNKKFFSDIVF